MVHDSYTHCHGTEVCQATGSSPSPIKRHGLRKGEVRGEGGSLIILIIPFYQQKKCKSQQKQGYGELDLAETA